jgi:3-hydroxyisobutyrate dehydrogenase
MGMGAARSLLRAGFATAACDVRRDALDAFAAAGGAPCANPAELGAKAEVVVVFVVNAEQTETVLFGANGAAAAMAAGSVVMLCVTAAPDYAERLGERLAERGLRCSTRRCRGAAKAAAGEMSIMASARRRRSPPARTCSLRSRPRSTASVTGRARARRSR